MNAAVIEKKITFYIVYRNKLVCMSNFIRTVKHPCTLHSHHRFLINVSTHVICNNTEGIFFFIISASCIFSSTTNNSQQCS